MGPTVKIAPFLPAKLHVKWHWDTNVEKQLLENGRQEDEKEQSSRWRVQQRNENKSCLQGREERDVLRTMTAERTGRRNAASIWENCQEIYKRVYMYWLIE